MIEGELKRRLVKLMDEGCFIYTGTAEIILGECGKELREAMMKEGEHNGYMWTALEKWFGEQS